MTDQLTLEKLMEQPPVSHQISKAGRGWPGRQLPISWLLGIGLLIASLRLPYLGHAVNWDEAWNLCAMKSLAGGSSLFSFQFWRHPPTYLLLGRLLDPLGPGFAWRMQFLSLILNTGAILAFVIMISRLYGKTLALYTGLVYAFLPGALFFDTWIKQDPVVTLFGILSLWAYSLRKNWLAGIFLGLAFLGKETAVYYAFPFLLLPWLFRYRQKKLAGVCLVYAIAFVVSAWWYLFMAAGSRICLDVFSGSSWEAEQFYKPWWYYPARLPIDLGQPGVIFFAIGLIAIIPNSWRIKQSWVSRILPSRLLLPLLIILPAYLLLSISYGKPSWMLVSLYPPLALITAFGWHFIVKSVVNQGGNLSFGIKQPTSVLLSGLLLVVLLAISSPGNLGKPGYMTLFRSFDPASLKTLQDSSEIAEAVNSLTQANEKLLILPMIYRGGPYMPDPIFFWRLNVPLEIIRSTQPISLDYQRLQSMIIKGKVDWILMSPIEGSDQGKIYKAFYSGQKSPQGYLLTNTVLLNVKYLWQPSATSPLSPPEDRKPTTTNNGGGTNG
ncbi:MAG: hypothetical protein HGA96_01495 [Desulfobulbaceae bacterium]|nr:hypothetical protein [Desulfobulbaceae bacterium]